MPRKVEVYDNELGTMIEMWAVDAQEAMERDPKRYSSVRPNPRDRGGELEPRRVPVGAPISPVGDETAQPDTAPKARELRPQLAPLDGRPGAPLNSDLNPDPSVPTANAVRVDEPQTDADDLTEVDGIGAGMVRRLNSMGVTTYAQLAELTPDQVAQIEASAPGMRGHADGWKKQAKELAAKKA